jgi:HEAT repeat protein
MEKFIEGDAPPQVRPLVAAPALAVQFFLIPLAVVAVVVAIYSGFRMMLAEERTVADYLTDIRSGGRERRWPAAFELSRLMSDPKLQAADPTLGPALVRAFEDAQGDDPRVRRYLALAIGRLQQPPPTAAPSLVAALNDADSETRISAVWALASLGNPAAVPELERTFASATDDAGIRKVVVYALGALPGNEQLDTLQTALADVAPDVQWNAAVALARHGDRSGMVVLRRMLDREYIEKTVTRTPRSDEDADPAGDVMISALQAIGALREKEDGMFEKVKTLSLDDRSLRVRQAALDALKQLG